MKTKKNWIYIRTVYPYCVIETSISKPEYYYHISRQEAERKYREKYGLLGARFHRVKDFNEFITLI